MKRLLICIIILITAASARGQYIDNYQVEPPQSMLKLGVGYGIDYGFIGVRFTLTPLPELGIFAAVGYNLIKTGFNGGVNYKFRTDKKLKPVVGLMYGNNAVIFVQGAKQYNKAYYGPSISGGIELTTRKRKNYWSFELVYAITPSEYQDDWDAIKNNPNIEVLSDPFPVSISVGYHFNI